MSKQQQKRSVFERLGKSNRPHESEAHGICHMYLKTGECQYGNNCKYLHVEGFSFGKNENRPRNDSRKKDEYELDSSNKQDGKIKSTVIVSSSKQAEIEQSEKSEREERNKGRYKNSSSDDNDRSPLYKHRRSNTRSSSAPRKSSSKYKRKKHKEASSSSDSSSTGSGSDDDRLRYNRKDRKYSNSSDSCEKTSSSVKETEGKQRPKIARSQNAHRKEGEKKESRKVSREKVVEKVKKDRKKRVDDSDSSAKKEVHAQTKRGLMRKDGESKKDSEIHQTRSKKASERKRKLESTKSESKAQRSRNRKKASDERVTKELKRENIKRKRSESDSSDNFLHKSQHPTVLQYHSSYSPRRDRRLRAQAEDHRKRSKSRRSHSRGRKRTPIKLLPNQSPLYDARIPHSMDREEWISRQMESHRLFRMCKSPPYDSGSYFDGRYEPPPSYDFDPQYIVRSPSCYQDDDYVSRHPGPPRSPLYDEDHPHMSFQDYRYYFRSPRMSSYDDMVPDSQGVRDYWPIDGNRNIHRMYDSNTRHKRQNLRHSSRNRDHRKVERSSRLGTRRNHKNERKTSRSGHHSAPKSTDKQSGNSKKTSQPVDEKSKKRRHTSDSQTGEDSTKEEQQNEVPPAEKTEERRTNTDDDEEVSNLIRDAQDDEETATLSPLIDALDVDWSVLTAAEKRVRVSPDLSLQRFRAKNLLSTIGVSKNHVRPEIWELVEKKLNENGPSESKATLLPSPLLQLTASMFPYKCPALMETVEAIGARKDLEIRRTFNGQKNPRSPPSSATLLPAVYQMMIEERELQQNDSPHLQAVSV